MRRVGAPEVGAAHRTSIHRSRVQRTAGNRRRRRPQPIVPGHRAPAAHHLRPRGVAAPMPAAFGAVGHAHEGREGHPLESGIAEDAQSVEEIRSNVEILVEVVAALSASVAISTVCINGELHCIMTTIVFCELSSVFVLIRDYVLLSFELGVWRLDYNKIAAHALLRVVDGKMFALRVTSKLLERRKQKSALFLCQLPSLVETGFVDTLRKMGESEGPVSTMEWQDEQQLDLIMDRLVRDTWEGKGGCILDALCRKDGEGDGFSLSVVAAEKSSLVQACKDIVATQKLLVCEGTEAAMSCAAASILAHFHLGKFERRASCLVREYAIS